MAIGQRKKLEQQSFKLDSNVFSHKKFSSKIFCAQLQVQKLEKIILARVKIKDLNIRVDISNQGIFAVIYIHRLIKKKQQNFTGLKPAKTTLFVWTALWKLLIFIIRFSWDKAGQVNHASFMVEFGQILPFSSTHVGFFFADFYWDMLGQWTDIYNLCYHIVVLKKKINKTVKNCSSRTLFGQKLGQHGPHPTWSSNFFLKITKGDHKLSRTFYFIQILYVLTELWMIFWLIWYFAAKTSQFWAETGVPPISEQPRKCPS